ncbi:hypothetical protein ICN30_11255 [Polynucleobacter sp. 31A-FELB]|uniref:hypothetical protein n=1 Tax=Polynucleobacter sp. 31A-FELB TaxID=2689096 RepID=UPI001C0E838F|nr:hypothetical protein [Polynucleobacter sp. 31A-FELB]MBU3588412.1 hypothetical protein [Polynucleobacter sp. 31A-FELB]
MTTTIWARPFTHEELIHLRQGKKHEIFFSDSLALIGRADHLYVRCLNVDVKLRRVHLGHGQYIDDATWREATGGKKISVTWSIDSIYGYLFCEAAQLNINVCNDPRWPSSRDIFLFDKSYIDQFIEALIVTDNALCKRHESRSLLSRWFDANDPNHDSKEAAVIRETIRRILIR